jgi:4-amino-4-deoxy-L-arabinose transferase-like glycosyltransferase
LNSNQPDPKWLIWLEWIALLVIVALATFLRYWRIDQVPPGFNSDEAVGAMGALTTLREGLKYSYEGQGGGGALGFYFAAASFYLFGPSIAAIRGVAAWAGVVSIFANYWAIRELFRPEGLNRARWIALLSTLALTVSLWHLRPSRIAFAGIGVPFLLLPSVYFLFLGLNKQLAINNEQLSNPKSHISNPKPVLSEVEGSHIPHPTSSAWPFVLSGLFLGGLMYIYLSGVFAPPFYAAFFIGQWLVFKLAQRFNWPAVPAEAYLTARFRGLLLTGLTAGVLLLPLVYVLLSRSDLEPGTTRVGQASFLNPLINQGDPWGLLWRSITGNFAAYGVSASWFIGQAPRLSLPAPVAFFIFIGFLLALWRGLRGRAAYLFSLLWFAMLLLPSILSPDVIPHDLRTIGATTPAYVLGALGVIGLFELLGFIGQRWLRPRLDTQRFTWLARGVGVALALALIWIFWRATATSLVGYFYLWPQTEAARAAYHVYAVDMAEEIEREPHTEAAFILPRNTAAGDVFRNFTTDFLVELDQPPAAHYWVIDNETTLAADLTTAAAEHSIMRLVHWKTSKHTGADPKDVISYYLEKYGHFERTDVFEYYDIDTYVLDVTAPDFDAAETLHPSQIDFGGQLQLTGYALGDAGAVDHVAKTRASSNDLLWLRLAWQKLGPQTEDLKVSALVYTADGRLVTQIDKLLLSNILQAPSTEWEVGAQEETYFLIPIPPATPPGTYRLDLAVYGDESLARLPAAEAGPDGLLALAEFTVAPATRPVNPDDLTLALPVQQELLPGLTLVGFETLPGDTVRSGAEVGASLIWQAGETPLPVDLTMALTARAGEGDAEWPLSEPLDLAGAGYPTTRWQPGDVLRGWLAARIPPAFEPGLYRLRLRLTAAGTDAEPLVLPIGDFQVEGWPRVFESPQPQFELEADFAGQATLVGLDAEAAQVAPGESLTARLYWRAEAEFDREYTAFIHLIGPDGLLYGQVDQIPGGGAYPTTGWLPGEYIADAYTVPVAPGAPPGDYVIEIGMYDPQTGQRLSVSGPHCQTEACLETDDKVLLPGLKVQ